MNNTTKTIEYIKKRFIQNLKLIAQGHEKANNLIDANNELDHIYWLLCGRDLYQDIKKYL